MKPANTSDEQLVEMHGLSVHFLRRGFGKARLVRAVDGIELTLSENEVLGLVGESGCGKTTTARVLVRLTKPTAGTVRFRGRDIFAMNAKELKSYRRNTQMIFQDPYESLNPSWTTFDTIASPIRAHHLANSESDAKKMAEEILQVVELNPEEIMLKYPHQLSGGMRQRVNIARALVIQPKLVIADEPVSMLDVSIRAGVLNLLLRLKEDRQLSYLFITHDLAVARYMCDRIGVMYLGRIVEITSTEELVRKPYHPYTRLLLESSPRLTARSMETSLEMRKTTFGEVPSAAAIPQGCRFHPRCPFANALCTRDDPMLVELSKMHSVACHYPLSASK